MPDFDFADAPLRLIDFLPGQKFENAIFMASDFGVRTASNGLPFLLLKLRDCSAQVGAKLFSAPPDILQRLEGARFVSVRGWVEDGSFRGNFRLTGIEIAPAPDDLTPFLAPLPTDCKAHRARFDDVVRSIQNPHLKALLKAIFARDGEVWPRFIEATAAKTMHHAYRGGLLEHCGEVAILCDRVAATLPHLNRDLLVCAALLHDIGKLDEMESGLESGNYTLAGNLVGHIVLGTCLVASAADKIDDFPSDLKHELMHLILSHHGEPEWGAAKRPMCAEALVLSLCDQMSAKTAQCRQLAQAEGEELFAKSSNWHGAPNGAIHSVYLGLMREMMKEE